MSPHDANSMLPRTGTGYHGRGPSMQLAPRPPHLGSPSFADGESARFDDVR